MKHQHFFVAVLAAHAASCTNGYVTSPSPAAPSRVSAAGATIFIGRFDAGIAASTSSADAPTPPANLTATVFGAAVTLSWTAAAGSPTTYVLEAGLTPGSANLANFATGSTETSFTASHVPAGTYYVRVRARNADGTSTPSNEVTVIVTGGPCAGPNAPAGLTASVSGSTVTLQWHPPAGGNATSYVLEVGTGSGLSNAFNQDVGNTFTVSGSAPPGTYFARVRARNACATSAPSNEVQFTVGGGGGVNLSGTWTGTLTVTEGSSSRTEQVTFNFQHSGTRLTAIDPLGFVSFDLTESAATSSTRTFSGTMRFVDPGEPCSPATMPGSFIVNTTNLTMSGTFSGQNEDCRQETDRFTLQRASAAAFVVTQ